MGRRCQDGGRDGGYHLRASWREDAATGERQYPPAKEEQGGGSATNGNVGNGAGGKEDVNR